MVLARDHKVSPLADLEAARVITHAERLSPTEGGHV